jgi:hypothetical protein
VLKFKTGAFVPGVAVLPVCIKVLFRGLCCSLHVFPHAILTHQFPFSHFSLAFDSIPVKVFVFRMLCQVAVHVHA